ncbi:hypothetical protein F5141DRAFT_1218112 [Pisolithus sp. B1]|nr:hypothetical protein F5141DRAFT_1218112 [Pisolithus sp. B1]
MEEGSITTLQESFFVPWTYDWSNTDVHSVIREFQPNFHVTAHSWPSFLYADGDYDLLRPAKRLFKGKYLVMAFQCIFTSPSSTQNELNSGNTHRHVAKLLRMNTVQLQVIAYVATQLHFAFSSCLSWMIVDKDFNHEEFYHNIVNYFELPSSPQKAAELNDLLTWWNQ